MQLRLVLRTYFSSKTHLVIQHPQRSWACQISTACPRADIYFQTKVLKKRKFNFNCFKCIIHIWITLVLQIQKAQMGSCSHGPCTKMISQSFRFVVLERTLLVVENFKKRPANYFIISYWGGDFWKNGHHHDEPWQHLVPL